jgi:AhpD family alkylhydroperoxidase
MAHIRLPQGIPGILGPMAFSPETAKPLNALAEVLLRGPNTLTPAERELIATYVSSQNDCHFCQSAHGAVAERHLGGDEELVNAIKLNFESADISSKLKASAGDCRQSPEGREAGRSRRRRRRTPARRDRQGDSRHRADRGSLLHVQSLRGWLGHLGSP